MNIKVGALACAFKKCFRNHKPLLICSLCNMAEGGNQCSETLLGLLVLANTYLSKVPLMFCSSL